MHPGDEDVGSEETPHGLASVDGELPAVEIFIDLVTVRIAKRHVDDGSIAATAAGSWNRRAIRRGIGGIGTEFLDRC